MLHPVFSLLISRPGLVIDHVAGYAALIQEEATDAGMTVARRALAWAVALLSLMVFLVLAGVAVMLGTTLGEFHWSLVVTPGVALLVSLLAGYVARNPLSATLFTQFKAQLNADVLALRLVEPAP